MENKLPSIKILENAVELRLSDLNQKPYEWLVIAHEPIKDSDGVLNLLYASARDSRPWLRTIYGRPGDGWFRELGFAFVASQVSSQPSNTQSSALKSLELGHSVFCPSCNTKLTLTK